LTAALTLLLAQPANPYLEAARGLARELKFAEAIAQLKVARQVPDLQGAQRVEVLELLARCQIAEGNRADAEAAFTELLSLEPEHELDRQATSPKIVAVFDEVKRRLFPDERVSLVEESAPPGRVRARVVDPFKRVRRAELVTRTGAGPWVSEPLTVGDKLLDLPAPTAPGTEARAWYLRLVGDSDEVLATLASAEAPRTSPARLVSVETQASAPAGGGLTGTKVAALVSAGLAVVAVGVGTGLQLNAQALDRAARDASRPPGDWADTARATHADAVAQARWSVGLFLTGGVAAASATALFLW
jgi:hypothetical protein